MNRNHPYRKYPGNAGDNQWIHNGYFFRRVKTPRQYSDEYDDEPRWNAGQFYHGYNAQRGRRGYNEDPYWNAQNSDNEHNFIPTGSQHFGYFGYNLRIVGITHEGKKGYNVRIVGSYPENDKLSKFVNSPFISKLINMCDVEFQATNDYMRYLSSLDRDKVMVIRAIGNFELILDLVNAYERKHGFTFYNGNTRKNIVLRISNRLAFYCATERLTEAYCNQVRENIAMERKSIQEICLKIDDEIRIGKRIRVVKGKDENRFFVELCGVAKKAILAEDQFSHAINRANEFLDDVMNSTIIVFPKTFP
ncbi:hypothetical protein PGO_140220 [Plasmodium gonderi]|uniref:Uncharacterized protein n=1 Tax=Plasmodium gonderi TaxID=77519 RepID=A0A1Y1JNX3_PLAGO|nr:hypothetical protein PGO_140220 [Plasmodium gonderi]GAW83228.1 hypothetical protein PGO_140220 [Plasmodium gonderi]